MSDLKAHLSRHRHIPVITKEVTRKLVSDGIGDTYRSWNAKEPVLISAQTGSGKNYFAENFLIPYVRQNKKRLLLVSNRVAVSLQ
ncbi:MAG: hypothetical protein VB100_04670 [Angelakisella sp.]|nr:hypothetical protein [Angelakisella sp.]